MYEIMFLKGTPFASSSESDGMVERFFKESLLSIIVEC